MISYHLLSALLGLLLCAIIFSLVRRGKLHEKYSLPWFLIGFIIVLLGFFPRIIDWLAQLLGVHYAPTLLFVLAVAVLLIQNLSLSIKSSQNEVRIKQLCQQLAVQGQLLADVMEQETVSPEISTALKAEQEQPPDRSA